MKGTRIKISTKLVMRSYILFAVIIAAFAFLAYKIFAIQTVNFDYYQQKVINQLTTESTVYSKRGSIYDSEGVQLATNISAYRIFIAPSNIRAAVSESTGDEAKNYDDIIARGLSEILGEKYGVRWLPSDFKKREGYKRSIQLSGEYGLYRQDYCGCLFSKPVDKPNETV